MSDISEAKLVTRLAGPDDYNAVMSISKGIYNGVDYIPYTYRVFQQDPNCYMFISELNGKPICFSVYNIINAGQTALGASGRIAPQYKGTGLFGQHSEDVRNMVFSMNLGFKEIAFTAHNLEVHERRLQDKSFNLTLASKQPVMYYRGNRADILKAVTRELENNSQKGRTSTYQLSVQEALDILQDQDNVRRLFPESHFLATTHWLTLRPTQKNLNWLAKNTNIVATKTGAGIKCELISHGHILPCPAGTRLALYAQGPQMEEENFHILLQLAHACKVSRTDVLSVLIQLSCGTNVNAMHARMANLSMTEFNDAEQIVVYNEFENAKL